MKNRYKTEEFLGAVPDASQRVPNGVKPEESDSRAQSLARRDECAELTKNGTRLKVFILAAEATQNNYFQHRGSAIMASKINVNYSMV